MFLNCDYIADENMVTEIVIRDYRTSTVFRKHGIDYCCSGRIPLKKACEIRGLDTDVIKNELRDSLRNIQIPSSTNFSNWNIDFLVDYLVNVHHSYLINNLPDILATVESFVSGHAKKQPHLSDILKCVSDLRDEILPHLEKEEKIIFPYIKQVSHAYKDHEPYAALLVRTLRKPVEDMVKNEHQKIATSLHRLRELTDNYTPPPNACISHKVSFYKLKELDDDLVQHVHLEGNILFPRAISMEKEMLATN